MSAIICDSHLQVLSLFSWQWVNPLYSCVTNSLCRMIYTLSTIWYLKVNNTSACSSSLYSFTCCVPPHIYMHRVLVTRPRDLQMESYSVYWHPLSGGRYAVASSSTAAPAPAVRQPTPVIVPTWWRLIQYQLTHLREPLFVMTMSDPCTLHWLASAPISMAHMTECHEHKFKI